MQWRQLRRKYNVILSYFNQEDNESHEEKHPFSLSPFSILLSGTPQIQETAPWQTVNGQWWKPTKTSPHVYAHVPDFRYDVVFPCLAAPKNPSSQRTRISRKTRKSVVVGEWRISKYWNLLLEEKGNGHILRIPLGSICRNSQGSDLQSVLPR